MIPILFDANAQDFTTNGLGRLSDCISFLVTEERNGIYEAEFQYPITGIHYDLIEQGRIVLVSHDEQQDKQPFVIYRVSKPINGIITANAHHISYKLSGVIISPFTASSVTDAFDGFIAHSLTDNPFTFWTDKASGGSFKVETPTSCKRLLGGVEGSILDSFGGGEYEWDNYTVKLYANRGHDNGVTIRYGKNLTGIDQTVDTMDLYNAVIPYWSDSESTVVYGGIVYGNGGIRQTAAWTNENNVPINDENGNVFDFTYYISQVTTMDLSSDFDNQPTVAELEARALTVLNSNQPWLPKENIKIDFVSLWQTEEYKDIAPLERVQLCDTVSVYYPELGVNATAKVIKVVWDAMTDRYDSIELGEAKSSFADVLQAETNEKLAEVPNISMMEEAIQHATDLITGGMGGHIVFLYDADGKPTDMLVMDTEDVATAVHVLRINVNGIGFSSTGTSGTFTSAWTLDGSFVADWITAGHLSANRIQGGTLTLGGANNGNGVIVVYDASGTEIGRWNNEGLSATGNLVMHNSYSSNSGTVSHTAECYIGRQRMFSRAALGRATAYDRSDAQGFIMYDLYKRNGYADAFTYYKSINMDGAWTGDTTLADGNGVRSVLVNVYTGNRYWDASILDSSSATNDLSPYVNAYVELVEDVWANVLGGSATWKLTGHGTYSGVDFSQIDAEIYLGGKGWIQADSSGIFLGTNGYTVRGKYSLSNIAYNSNNWYIVGDTVSGFIAVSSSSSRRYKHDITDQIDEELDAHRLYDLTMKQFVYNSDCEYWQYCDLQGKTLPGFIAEEVDEIYPSAVIHDPDGRVESWDERRIIPGMLTLIQEQHEEIESLKDRIAKLETIVENLMR